MDKVVETSKAGERTPVVTLSKGGTKERKVKLSALEIPDLWRTDSPEKVMEVWHIAHDLKRELWELHAQRDEQVIRLTREALRMTEERNLLLETAKYLLPRVHRHLATVGGLEAAKAAIARAEGPTNKFRRVNNIDWMRRELSRLEDLRPVSTGDARESLETTIAQAKQRFQELQVRDQLRSA